MTYDQGNACDNDLLASFNLHGICEPEVVCAMERIVRPGDIVIDGGANIGFFSIYLSYLVGPTGKVIAIEPGQNNIWKLEQNVRLNKLKNVEIVRKPLWKNHDKVTLYMRHEGGRNSLFPGETYQGNVQIEACTLADFPVARLVKLDIEGAEVAALVAILCRAPFVIAELNEKVGTDQSDLRAKYPDTFLLDKDGYLPKLVPRQTRIIAERQNTNILLSTVEQVGHIWREVVA